MSSEDIEHISDDNFEQQVIQTDGLCLVDYWAEWCGPCKMLAPVLDQIAAEYRGRVKIFKLDIDSNPITPQKYAVRSIPTLMLFREGKVVASQAGALSKKQLSDFLEKNI